jgi:bisphosphoglycerate-dependent phosphoglycerate mutase
VQELYKFSRLQEHLRANNQKDAEVLEKRFRIMVKKRLNKEHSEDLSGLRTKADKQAFLEDAFQKCLESFQVTIPVPNESK